jgi:hypothetical protein
MEGHCRCCAVAACCFWQQHCMPVPVLRVMWDSTLFFFVCSRMLFMAALCCAVLASSPKDVPQVYLSAACEQACGSCRSLLLDSAVWQ